MRFENGPGPVIDPLTRPAPADGLKTAPARATLPDFWGPMDPIGVRKSDSPKGERVRSIFRSCVAHGFHDFAAAGGSRASLHNHQAAGAIRDHGRVQEACACP